MAASLATKVREASSEEIEPLVALYDDLLTMRLESFQAQRASDPFGALQDVQVMSGTVTMIPARATIGGSRVIIS